MRNKTMTSTLAASMTIAALGLPTCVFAADYEMTNHTIDGGGGVSTGGDFVLSGTIGQPDAAEPATGGNFIFTGGFWPGGQVAPPADDASIIKPHFGEIAGVDLTHPKWDFDRNGGVTGGDFSLIKPKFGDIGAACP